MNSNLKTPVLLLINFLLASCSTVNLAKNKTSFTEFCDSGKNKQSVFLVASYNGVPKGTPIASINKIIKSSSETTEFVKNHFIQALLVYGYTGKEDRPLIENEELTNIFKNRFVHGWAPTLRHLAWGSQNKFVICEKANCDGMKYPESQNEFVEFDWQNWDDGRCHDFFMEEGYVSGWGCRGNAFGLLSFMKDSGFNDGLLIANSYVLAPESQKQALCTGAGLPPDCFNIFNSNEQYHNFREMLSKDQNLEADYAFMKSFKSPDSDIAMMAAKAAFTKDLILKAGTKVSTKVANDWTIYRISWDSTLFCKYARPTSDFYTR